MTGRAGDVLVIVAAFGVMCLAGIIGVYWQKAAHDRRRARIAETAECFSRSAGAAGVRSLTRLLEKWPDIVVDQLRKLAQPVVLRSADFAPLVNAVRRMGLEKPFIRMLGSRRKYTRMKAASFLAVLPGMNAVAALEQAFARERDWHVRLYMGSALADHASPSSIPLLAESLPGSPLWYRNRVSVFLQSFGKEYHDYLPAILERDEVELKAAIVDFATVYVADDLKAYLLRHAESPNRDIVYRSVRALGALYTDTLNDDRFVRHADPVVRNITISALAKFSDLATLRRVLPLITDEGSGDHAIATVSTMARLDPRHVELLVAEFRACADEPTRGALARILSNRIEYLLLRLLSSANRDYHAIVEGIASLGKINGLIGFMNKNRNIELENEVLPIIKRVMAGDEGLRREFRLYLNERLLGKLGYERLADPPAPRDEKREKEKLVFLYVFLLAAVLLVPATHVALRWDGFFSLAWREHAELFVVDFNYFVAYYSITVNAVYLTLLFFSFLGVRMQMRYWHLKTDTFLFKQRMLPSVSIIAPAFREEATIVESVKSLLNLKYPDYELIVVNDGSPDNTLNRLISCFNLEKVDVVVPRRLNTKPVRGVYVNKDIPRLMVVDKANGGKADSLNAGINLSRKEYFCGIDADSLLEQEALLRLASLAVDSKHEAVALGGNVFPANGCAVRNGEIIERKIPDGFWPRLQTAEYLRAFMAGRLGWAYLKSLLIISGAFGLFRKDRVIAIGGYLTSSERFRKDTVGEDMELVVRLTRSLGEQKVAHKIFYSYNANCWTEVPEHLTVLLRQRDRWQRGLLDILSFHRRMIFNPGHGATGLIAMPYFLIFEMVGPLIEAQGFIAVLLAAMLGLLNVEIALLLFLGSVLMGVTVSVYSLLIAEQEINYFSRREISLLVLVAVLENFGIRQLMSLWRISGYVNSLRAPQGWGKMPRKGFTPAPGAAVPR